MSEEEKKAVERVEKELENEKNAHWDYQWLTGWYGNSEIEILLNLIEKQSKEIEELRNSTICGRTIDEIVNILTGLDIEKQYKIDVTMENLKSLMGIYQAEVEKSIQNVQIKIVDDLLGKGSKIEFELPHYNFDEENNK